MAIVTPSRRIFSLVLKSNKNTRLYSTVSANGPKEPIIASSILGDPSSTTPPPLPPPESAEAGRVGGQPWSFLKYTLLAAVTGGVATAGYATYAYTLEEVDQKTKALRASANVSVGDDLSSSDKFQAMLKSAAMTGAFLVLFSDAIATWSLFSDVLGHLNMDTILTISCP
ncbi:hypothetical protein Tco_0411726 [Tanacetum coccineum]